MPSVFGKPPTVHDVPNRVETNTNILMGDGSETRVVLEQERLQDACEDRGALAPWWLVVGALWFLWGSGLLHGVEGLVDHVSEQRLLLQACATLGTCCSDETATRVEALFRNLDMAYWKFRALQATLALIVVGMAFEAVRFREVPWWVRSVMLAYALYMCLWRLEQWGVVE